MDRVNIKKKYIIRVNNQLEKMIISASNTNVQNRTFAVNVEDSRALITSIVK